MEQIFSTKMDVKVLRALEAFCRRHHIVKSRLLEEIIKEGIRKRSETLQLAESLKRGLDDEREGNFDLPPFSGRFVKTGSPVSRTQKGSNNPVLNELFCNCNTFPHTQRSFLLPRPEF